ncbi:MAG: hypothetical protein IT431_00530 [Phycisphaerales bacterium]|nr:hypothetical protein [Phycisphaerales bacterium]
MDPNLFHLDWERTLEALVAIIVLAFFVERACALVFESRWYIWFFEDRRVGSPVAPVGPGDGGGEPAAAQGTGVRTRLWPIKEILAFGVALVICLTWDFDAVSMIILSDQSHLPGKFVTAAVIAGGSKASVKLFQDLMGIRSNAAQERKKIREQEAGV